MKLDDRLGGALLLGSDNAISETFGASVTPSVPGFLIDVLLGEGGQNRVWGGLREKDGLAVAVKEPFRAWDEDDCGRLTRSAVALSRLRAAPWVEHLVAVERMQDGAPCVVTRLFDGQHLAKRFATGLDRAPAELVLTFLRLATALSHVHAHGLVHRDVTPWNVLVSSADHALALIDFGLALDPSAAQRTAEGTSSHGTLGFMSPEQQTNPSVVDYRSDVWQFGAALDLCRGGARADVEMTDSLDEVVSACRRTNRDERPQGLEPVARELRQLLARLVSRMGDEPRSDDDRLLGDTCRLELSAADASARDRLVSFWRDRAAKSPAEAVSALGRAFDLRPEDTSLSVGALAEGRVSTQIEGRRGAAPDPEVWEA